MRDRYQLEMTVKGFAISPSVWVVRNRGLVTGDGMPTEANLAKHVARFEDSTRPGRSNAHLGETKVASARIRDWKLGGAVIARYVAPAPSEAEVDAFWANLDAEVTAELAEPVTAGGEVK